MADDDTKTVGEIVEAVRSDVAKGLDIVERTLAEQNIQARPDEAPDAAWLRPHAESVPVKAGLGDEISKLIANILEYERAGRRVSAGAGLVRLREHYDALDRAGLPDDEQTWEAYAAKHVRLAPERVSELAGKMVHHGGMLRCTKCGTGSQSYCGCGRPYVSEHRWGMSVEAMLVEASPERANEPSALDRAIAAVEAHPEKSNRALAAEIGCDDKTIAKARRAMEESAPDSAPATRVGRDGRSYPATTRKPSFQLPDPDRDLIQDMHPDAITEEQRWQWSAANAAGDAVAMRAFWAREFGDWQRFKPPPELLTLAQEAMAAWQSLATDLEERL